MRVDKYLAQSTGLTRSQARKLLRSGGLCVDGVVVKSAAASIDNNVTGTPTLANATNPR